MRTNGGKVTLADLSNYEARLRQPVHSTYRGYDLYGMPLPSSGGVAVAEALNILEGYDLKAMPREQAEVAARNALSRMPAWKGGAH